MATARASHFFLHVAVYVTMVTLFRQRIELLRKPNLEYL